MTVQKYTYDITIERPCAPDHTIEQIHISDLPHALRTLGEYVTIADTAEVDNGSQIIITIGASRV